MIKEGSKTRDRLLFVYCVTYSGLHEIGLAYPNRLARMEQNSQILHRILKEFKVFVGFCLLPATIIEF